MQCPGCGDELKAVSIAGFDYSYRCEKCGGVWAANWVVNNLSSGKPLTIVEQAGEKIIKSGNNKCPTDEANLVGVTPEVVPEGVAIEKCNLCGWWWFPEDEIFKFVKAMNTKREYVRLWNKNEWMNYAWPALVITLLVGGLTGSVVLVRMQQRAEIQASEKITNLEIFQIDVRSIQVRFKSVVSVERIEYKLVNELRFKSVDVVYESGYYSTKIENLAGGNYVIKISGREMKFEVK